jgi:adenylate kinase family enzyme
VSKIFVSGPSGVGKTTLGNKLTEYGWTHIDCEKMHLKNKNKWLKNPFNFIPDKKNLILTWGLTTETFPTAEKIIDKDFKYIWITGNKEYINFYLRKRKEKEKFILDPKRNEPYVILKKRKPDLIIDAFDGNGSHIDVDIIIHKEFWT